MQNGFNAFVKITFIGSQIAPYGILISKISWGACPQTPLGLLCTCGTRCPHNKRCLSKTYCPPTFKLLPTGLP